jgi:hypothetical protein
VAGMGCGVGGDLFGGAGGYDLAAAAAALRAHVDDPVGRFDDVQVVLDDEEGAAAFDEFAEGCEEFGYVVEVEAGGGLVEDVEGAAAGLGCGFVGGAAVGDGSRGGEVGGEFDALGFAARERGGGLSETDVAEADLVEDVKLVDDLWVAGEVDECLLDGHVEDVVDVLAFVADVEDGGFVACSVTFFAGEFDVGEELHLDGDGAVAFADVAAAAGDVEGEVSGAEAAALSVWLGGEEGADVVEGFDVGDGVGSRGAADCGLVDEDDVVEVVGAGKFAVEVCGIGAFGLAESLHESAVEDLVDDGGLAGAADAGDAACGCGRR